jgi:hypothetical protein
MKGTVYLIMGIIALVEVVYHIFNYGGKPGSIFGFDIPNIPYLLIWSFLVILFFYRYYTIRKANVKQ